MKQLFTVRSTASDKIQDSFESKLKAKKLRDELNGGKWNDEGTKKEFVISRGVDHRHGMSGLTPPTPKTIGGNRRKKPA